MIRKVRQRAAEIGCDAVLLSGPTDRVQSYSSSSVGRVNPGTGTHMRSHTGQPNYVRSHRAACFDKSFSSRLRRNSRSTLNCC